MRSATVYLIHLMNQIGAFLLAVALLVWHELRDKRKAKGMTLEQAAEHCGVDPSTYARWERGTQFPHPKNFQLLMETFDPYDEAWYADMSYVPDAFLPPSYWND